MIFVPDLPLSYAELGQRARDMRQRLDDAGVAISRCPPTQVQVALTIETPAVPCGAADDPASAVSTYVLRYDLKPYALERHIGTVYGTDCVAHNTTDVEWHAVHRKRIPRSVMRRDLRKLGVSNRTLKRMPIVHVRSKWLRLCAPIRAYHVIRAVFVLGEEDRQFFVHESSTTSHALALLHIMIEQGDIEWPF